MEKRRRSHDGLLTADHGQPETDIPWTRQREEKSEQIATLATDILRQFRWIGIPQIVRALPSRATKHCREKDQQRQADGSEDISHARFIKKGAGPRSHSQGPAKISRART